MARNNLAAWLSCNILSWLLQSLAVGAQSLLPVTATGSKLFDSSGAQFYIRGTRWTIVLARRKRLTFK